jgi:hypothetical protein
VFARLNEKAQRLVHRIGIREHARHVGRQQYHYRIAVEVIRVLASHGVAKVHFFGDVVVQFVSRVVFRIHSFPAELRVEH